MYCWYRTIDISTGKIAAKNISNTQYIDILSTLIIVANRPGDAMSPKCFVKLWKTFLNWALFGINITGKYLNHMRYTSDIVIKNEKEDL